MTGTNETIGGGGFHHVAIRVQDFDASVKFYGETLGFREKITWGEGDKRAIMMDAGDGNYIEIFAGGTPGPKPEGAIIHFAIRTDDCDGDGEAPLSGPPSFDGGAPLPGPPEGPAESSAG